MDREQTIREIERLQTIREIEQMQAEQTQAEPEQTTPPSQFEAAAYGAGQGYSYGALPMLAGAAGALGAQQRGGGLSDIIDNYRKARDKNKGYQQKVRQEWPNTFLGTEIAAGLSSPISKIGKGIKGAMALGGLQGFNTSEADLTKGEVGGTLGDVAQGSAIGGAAQAVLGPVLSMMNPNKMAPSLAKVFLNTPEEVTEAYLKNPDLMKKAPYRFDVTKNLENSIDDLRLMSKGGSDNARYLLKDINLKGQDVAKWLDPLSEGIEKRVEGIWDNPKQKAAFDMVKGIQEKYKSIPEVSGSRVKDTVQSLQRATDWQNKPGSFSPIDKTVTKKASRMINENLKDLSPDYRQEMRAVSKDSDLLARIKEIDTSPQGMTNLFRRMETDKFGAAQIPRQTVEEFDQHMGTNFLEQAKNAYAREMFDKSVTNGSRNVNLYKNMLGEIPGVGKALGATVGAVVDKTGNKITLNAVNFVAQANKLFQSGAGEEFKKLVLPVMQQAQQGSAAASLSLMLLNKNNPDALKFLSEGEEEE